MKIIIIGDIHADFGALNRFINKHRPTIILQCGDFGWWPHHHLVERIRKNHFFDQYAIKLRGTSLYWCDGNHENHDDLQKRIAANQGGPIEIPVPGCYYMRRGSILTLDDGRNVLFFGGAMSTDKDGRTEGESWWASEVPIVEDLEHARAQVAAHGGCVDIVSSHTGPGAFLRQLPANKIARARLTDPTVTLLDMILDEFHPKKWFFGHFHLEARGEDLGCVWRCMNAEGFGGGWWVELD